MFQYSNYGYSSGVAGSQNVAAYSTRQSAAAAASYNAFKGTSLPADDAGPRPATAVRDFAPALTTTVSYRRPTPGGASCLDQSLSSGDVVPPPPPPSTSTPTDRLTSPAAGRPTMHVDAGALLYSLPLDRVAVHVDDDDDDDGDVRQQHARSHSAPAAPRHPPPRHLQTAAAGPCNPPPPPPSSWYLKKRTDAERRLLPSPPPPPPPSAASPPSPVPHDSTSHSHCRRTCPPSSDVELDGPAAVVHADGTTRRPNSVTAPPPTAVSGHDSSCEPALLTRRRLRAARGRLDLYAPASADCTGLASTVAGMAVVAVVALVVCAVSVQLLLRLTATHHDDDDGSARTTNVGDSLLPAATSRTDDSGGGTMITRTVVEEITVALAAVTVALDLCCLLTICIQCFFAVKLAHCRNAELRFVDAYLNL